MDSDIDGACPDTWGDLLRHDIRSWGIQFDRVEYSFRQYDHKYFLTRSTSCDSVLTSRRDNVWALYSCHYRWKNFTSLSALTFAAHFSHVRISLGIPDQRSALEVYDSSLRIFVIDIVSSHCHFWSLKDFSRGPVRLQLFWYSPLLCLPLLFCLRIFEGHTSLAGTDGRIATTMSVPFQTTVVQTSSLSWLRLRLSAPPLGILLLVIISLSRVASELTSYSKPLSEVLRALSRHMDSGSCNVSECTSLSLFQRFHVR